MNERSSNPAAHLLGLLLLLVLLAGGAYWFSKAKPTILPSIGPTSVPPINVGVPSHALTFGDGSVLEIFELTETELKLGTLASPAGFRGSWSQSGGGLGSPHNFLETSTATMNGNVTGYAWTGQPTTLLLRCRLIDAYGIPRNNPRYRWGDAMKGQVANRDEIRDWDQVVNGDNSDNTLPGVMIQLADGHGSWIDAHGPVGEDDTGHALGMAMFIGWSRSVPTLEFRAAIPGQAPVTWTMTNPVHPVTPKAWKTTTLPVLIEEPEFVLSFTGLRAITEGAPLFAPQFDFVSRQDGDEDAGPNRVGLEGRCVELEGSLGGRSRVGWIDLGGGMSEEGGRIAVDESLVKAHFVVSATGNYRYPRSTAVILLEGTVSDDGNSIVLASHGHKAHGLTKATSSIDHGGASHVTWKMDFQWNDPADEATTLSALRLEGFQPVCFVGNDELSIGSVNNADRSASSSGHDSELSVSFRWHGVPTIEKRGNTTLFFDKLPGPGTKLSLGMVMPLADQHFSFVVPVDAGRD